MRPILWQFDRSKLDLRRRRRKTFISLSIYILVSSHISHSLVFGKTIVCYVNWIRVSPYQLLLCPVSNKAEFIVTVEIMSSVLSCILGEPSLMGFTRRMSFSPEQRHGRMVLSVDSCGSLHPSCSGRHPPARQPYSPTAGMIDIHQTSINVQAVRVVHLVICSWKD